MDRARQISDQDIEASLSSLARLIDRYGDAYWPVFERLERELRVRQERRERVSIRLHSAKPARAGIQTQTPQ